MIPRVGRTPYLISAGIPPFVFRPTLRRPTRSLSEQAGKGQDYEKKVNFRESPADKPN